MVGRLLRVGLGSKNYGYARVAYGLPVPDVRYAKVPYLPWKFLKRDDPRLANSYAFSPWPEVDLFHLWNGVSITSRPWVTSFEAHLPRHPGYRHGAWDDLAMRRLRHRSCRRILPFSDYSRRFFLWQHRGRLDDAMTAKIEVFRGALAVDPEAVARHRAFLDRERDSLVLIYIGHWYFQKGGVPLLRAFLRLKDRLPGLRLRIISRLLSGDFVTGSGPADVERERAALQGESRVEWCEALPHAEVMEKIVTSHVGVLASLDDQQPWSPLECMSVGLPVIASGITALPEEVSDGRTGWLLPLPLQENLRWSGLTTPGGSPERRRAVEEAFETLTDGLVARIESLYGDRQRLSAMAETCVAHVTASHDPLTQALKLRRIYDESLGIVARRDAGAS